MGDQTHTHNHAHDHAEEHGHTHEHYTNAGSYLQREMPLSYMDANARDWSRRAFTVGIGGPVGSGKTALLLSLLVKLRSVYSIATVTNDIFTREDAEFLHRHTALPANRIVAIETGGCPHAAVREDISANLHALEQLHAQHACDLLFIESGGDNLAANYSRDLADFIVYVIDVAGGDKVPRKGGPGITGSDLLLINKCDLADAVGADLTRMEYEAGVMREGGPTIMAEVKNDIGVDAVIELITSAWKASGAEEQRRKDVWEPQRGKGAGPVGCV